MTYFFETYGCQMNYAESSSVEQVLLSRGWTRCSVATEADLIIINTCSVRITAETRVFGRIRHFSALKRTRSFAIMVMGCMAERLHDSLKKDFPKLDYVVGMFEREQFTDLFIEIENKRESSDTSSDTKLKPEFFLHPLMQSPNGVASNSTRMVKKEKAASFLMQGTSTPRIDYKKEFLDSACNEKPNSGYYFAPLSYSEGAFQSNIPIMNGCNNFCTFCIVPHVRGRELSRNIDDILTEIDMLVKKGVCEITLLGQNVNSYKGIDKKTGETISFANLLTRIARKCDETDQIKWIRFVSSHPKDLSDEAIEVIAQEPRVCKLVHLPIQHGSNTILKRMNRHYTREHYLGLVSKLRSAIPNLALSTDILVGFPGETDDDVEQTLELMQEVEFNSAFMYHYNPREGTKAYVYPDRISYEDRITRLQKVIDLQKITSFKKMEARVGEKIPVLIESYSRNNAEELFGHTELGEMVVLEGENSANLIGHFVDVQLHSLRGKTFRAKKL